MKFLPSTLTTLQFLPFLRSCLHSHVVEISWVSFLVICRRHFLPADILVLWFFLAPLVQYSRPLSVGLHFWFISWGWTPTLSSLHLTGCSVTWWFLSAAKRNLFDEGGEWPLPLAFRIRLTYAVVYDAGHYRFFSWVSVLTSRGFAVLGVNSPLSEPSVPLGGRWLPQDVSATVVLLGYFAIQLIVAVHRLCSWVGPLTAFLSAAAVLLLVLVLWEPFLREETSRLTPAPFLQVLHRKTFSCREATNGNDSSLYCFWGLLDSSDQQLKRLAVGLLLVCGKYISRNKVIRPNNRTLEKSMLYIVEHPSKHQANISSI